MTYTRPPRSKLRRVLRGAALASLAVVGGITLGYIVIPAIANTLHGSTLPSSVQFQGDNSMGPMAGPGLGANLLRQAVATVVSPYSARSFMEISVGPQWALSDEDLQAFTRQQPSTAGILHTGCDGPLRSVYLDLYVAQPGHTGLEASRLASANDGTGTQTFSFARIVNHMVTVQETGADRQGMLRVPHLIGTAIPYFGSFRGEVHDRRAEAAKFYPEIDSLQCPAGKSAKTLAEVLVPFGIPADWASHHPTAAAVNAAKPIVPRLPATAHATIELSDSGQPSIKVTFDGPNAQADMEAAAARLAATSFKDLPLAGVIRTTRGDNRGLVRSLALSDGTLTSVEIWGAHPHLSVLWRLDGGL